MEAHGVTPYTFRFVEEVPTDSVFKFHDTLTSSGGDHGPCREVQGRCDRHHRPGRHRCAYLLDFMAKTPVREIRAFDLDPYHVHKRLPVPRPAEGK